MAKQSRDRSVSHGQWSFSNLFTRSAPKPELATVGFMPATLKRMSSGLSHDLAYGTLANPGVASRSTPHLKRHLSWAAGKNGKARGTVVQVEEIDTVSNNTTGWESNLNDDTASNVSTDSETANQRVYWDHNLLKPATPQPSAKIRQRVPSPYPTKPRSSSLLEKDRSHSVTRSPVSEGSPSFCLDELRDFHPEVIESYKYRGYCSFGSLSDPEASDTVSSYYGSAAGGSSGTEGSVYETPDHEGTQARIPLPRRSSSPPVTPNAAPGLKVMQPANTDSEQAWLPTDPSKMDLPPYREFAIPRLQWAMSRQKNGRLCSTSVHPPLGTTGGIADRRGGPSHTPVPPYYIVDSPKMRPVDPEHLTRLLVNVVCKKWLHGLDDTTGCEADTFTPMPGVAEQITLDGETKSCDRWPKTGCLPKSKSRKRNLPVTGGGTGDSVSERRQAEADVTVPAWDQPTSLQDEM